MTIAVDLAAIAGVISAALPVDMDRARSRMTNATRAEVLTRGQTTVVVGSVVPADLAMNGAAPAARPQIIAARKVVPPIGRIRMGRRSVPASTKVRKLRTMTMPRSRPVQMCNRKVRR